MSTFTSNACSCHMATSHFIKTGLVRQNLSFFPSITMAREQIAAFTDFYGDWYSMQAQSHRQRQRRQLTWENNSSRKPHSNLIIVFCRHFSVMSNNFRFFCVSSIGSAVTEAPPSGQNDLSQKPDPYFLIVFD
jgi:hypothetical protein